MLTEPCVRSRSLLQWQQCSNLFLSSSQALQEKAILDLTMHVTHFWGSIENSPQSRSETTL